MAATEQACYQYGQDSLQNVPITKLSHCENQDIWSNKPAVSLAQAKSIHQARKQNITLDGGVIVHLQLLQYPSRLTANKFNSKNFMWRKWRPVNTEMVSDMITANKGLDWMDLHKATAFGSISSGFDLFELIWWNTCCIFMFA